MLSALLFAGGLQAQTVIVKCIDAKGGVAYTNDACPPGQSVAGARTYAAVHDDPQARAEVQRLDEQMQQRYRADRSNGSAGAGTPHAETTRDRQKRACAAARQATVDARTKNLDRSRRLALDKAAVDACFGL